MRPLMLEIFIASWQCDGSWKTSNFLVHLLDFQLTSVTLWKRIRDNGPDPPANDGLTKREPLLFLTLNYWRLPLSVKLMM